MGSVYRAEQLSTRKPRAVKVVHGRLLDDERSRARFVREATVAAQIASEHVVEVIAAGIDRTTELPYLVMELLDGGDLAAVVRHRGRLDRFELGAMFRQLCHGLAAAHHARVIHRDLKPENIFVAHPLHAGTRFTVKILDFGIAKVAQESKTAATLTGTVGSPLWMAPEQINNDPLGPQTDVWALGLLGFWALTGQSYWRTARAERLTIQALFAEQLFRELEAASVRAAEFGMADVIPPGFDDWFACCVARSPGARFVDAAAAWAAFEQSVDAGLRADLTLLPPRGTTWDSTSSRMPGIASTIAEHGESQSASVSDTGFGYGGAPASSAVPTIAQTNLTPLAEQSLGVSAEVEPPAAEVVPDERRVRARVPWIVAGAAAVAMLGVGAAAWWIVDASDDADDRPQGQHAEAERGTTSPVATTSPLESDRSAQGEGGLATSPADAKAPTDGAKAATTDPGVDPPHDVDAAEPVVDPDASAAEVAALAPVRPMATQPSFSSEMLEFRGWSADGSRFVLESTYAPRSATAPRNDLRLMQVHDALSSLLVESYRLDRVADPSINDYDRVSRAAAEAEPAADWPPRKAELALSASTAQALPPAGLARVELSMRPVAVESAIAIEPTSEGFAYRWNVARPVAGERAPLPHIVLHWTRGDARWQLLDIPVAATAEELWAAHPDAAAIVYAGSIALHWSPTGERIVVIVRGDVVEPAVVPAVPTEPVIDPTTGAPAVVAPLCTSGPFVDNRWFLRAGGAQIRLVDAGAGQRKLRAAAWRLQGAGFPIAAAEFGYETVESSRVYVRARDPAAAALVPAIGEAIGQALPSAILDRAGWTQVVVMLGSDLGATPTPQ
jgi:tRNA A-37 threonylcarbamoyl transferase component Bud32